jgi:hypothetical protein
MPWAETINNLGQGGSVLHILIDNVMHGRGAWRNGPAGPHQRFHRVRDAAFAHHIDARDLDDRVGGRVKAGGLDVEDAYQSSIACSEAFYHGGADARWPQRWMRKLLRRGQPVRGLMEGFMARRARTRAGLEKPRLDDFEELTAAEQADIEREAYETSLSAKTIDGRLYDPKGMQRWLDEYEAGR